MDEADGAPARVIELEAGEEIAGYRIIERVGAGGMGRVYRALHGPLDRIVAFKVIRPEIAVEHAFRQRFRREARLIAAIEHPSVVPVYDADEVDGVLFMAMRWVNGPDLRRQLAGGPLQPARAVSLLAQIAGAVDAAHTLGLVHRDIKPSNVLLEGDRAFLSDFGLARALGAGADASTVTGGFVGTADYTAPELLDGDPGDARGDIYALGCVLYEMLTGSVPYPVDSLVGKLHAHAHDERPRPSARNPELPRGFDDVVPRALAVDPAERYATACELSAAAERALRTPPATRRSARSRKRPRRAVVMALTGALVAAVTAAVVLLLTRGASGPAPYDSGGRALPAATSVSECPRQIFTGPPRTCWAPDSHHGRGIVMVGDIGSTLRMSTMTIKPTGVRLTSALSVPYSGGHITAPRGTRFVVIDLTVTNVTGTRHQFESSEDLSRNGRLTGLWLINRDGRTIRWQGPHSADYSVQYDPAVNGLKDPLYQATLSPGLAVAGQLVFYYPTADLRQAAHSYLLVKELGEPFGSLRSEALIRLRL